MAAAERAAALTPYRAEHPFDWDAALALIRRAFAGMEGRINPPSSLHHFTARDLQAGEFWCIGVPPVACVLLTPKPDALYLGKLAVDPGLTRHGLARALIATAETRARALDLPALELQTRVELTENHATFQALGFQEIARTAHAGFDRPTAITFHKSLCPLTEAANIPGVWGQRPQVLTPKAQSPRCPGRSAR